MTSILKVNQIQNTTGTTALTIDSSGYVFAKLPHFSAKSTSAQAIANATVVTAAIDTSVSDTHSFVDLSNNKINFSAITAGTYLITYSAKVNNASSNRLGMWVRKIAAGGAYIAYFEEEIKTGSSSGSYAMPSYTFMYPFVAGDFLQVDFYQNSGGSISTNYGGTDWAFQISGVRIG